MSLGEVKVVLSERLCLQAGVDIALKGEDRLAGILRRKVRVPVVETGGVQIRQLVADAHQLADLRRGQLTGDADKLLRILEEFGLGIASRCQRALIIERFSR